MVELCGGNVRHGITIARLLDRWFRGHRFDRCNSAVKQQLICTYRRPKVLTMGS